MRFIYEFSSEAFIFNAETLFLRLIIISLCDAIGTPLLDEIYGVLAGF